MEKSVKKYWPFFLIPTVGAFVIGFIIPFIEGVYLSFCKFNTIKDAEWVGFKNFIYIFMCCQIFQFKDMMFQIMSQTSNLSP